MTLSADRTTDLAAGSAAAGVTAGTSSDLVRFTSCRTPTATAFGLGDGLLADLTDAAGAPRLANLRDLDPETAEHHHQIHDIPLFREGGNIPPLWTRARGARTRLLGLTWIEEGQALVTRPDTVLTGPAGLRGLRYAVPAARVRLPQLQRPVALHGLEGALALGGLAISDVEIVEVDSGEGDVAEFWRGAKPATSRHPAIDAVADGLADVAYVVGPQAHDHAAARGLVVAVDLDRAGERTTRVNLGTPRALTVDADTLDRHRDLVVDYLARLLRAADRAEADPQALVDHVTGVSGAARETVARIYAPLRGSLRPTLDPEVVDLYVQQKDFLLRHGFIDADFDVRAWSAPDVLAEAVRRVDGTA